MPSKSDSIANEAAAPSTGFRKAADYFSLTKPRINALVGVTTFAGFYMAGATSFDWTILLHALVGTVLLGSGGSVLNQVWEKDSDARMERTKDRAVTAGRVSAFEATVFGVVLGTLGGLYLLVFVNPLTAFVGAASAVLYVLVYTPLKSRSLLSTLVGAVPGALPPLIGWTAAGGRLDLLAWSLFSVLFIWQLPHFMAIAWVHREDYKRAGTLNLAVLDPDGTLVSQQALLHSFILLPVSLAPTLVGLAGIVYCGAAVVLGLVFIGYCVAFFRNPTTRSARSLFYYSLVYLPVLYLFMMLDRTAG